MNAVTYGELLARADRHLDAAERSRAGSSDAAGALGELYRLTVLMARHLEIVNGPDIIMSAARSPWHRAASEICELLHLAADGIAEAVLQTEGTSFQAEEQTQPAAERPAKLPGEGVRYLARTADALAAGHDLIRTHAAPGPDGTPADRSDWARVARSQPAALAVVQEMARWSTRVASWLTWLMTEDAVPAEAARAGLYTASGWLHAATQIASTTIDTTAEAASGMITARELLCGFPAASVPDRIAPRPGESTAGLCAGIASSAERLRAVAFTQPQLAHASPSVSGPAWLRTAWAGAVLTDMCAGMLHSLAERSQVLTAVAVRSDRLHHAAKAFTSACAAWRQAASMWQSITTDTQTVITGATAETGDSVQRMGRLAFANPGWTPAASQRAPRRNPALLAPDRSGFLTVLGAIHQVADAISKMADADLAAITIVGDAGRFYMPNAILWDERAQFRNYAAAPRERVLLLRDVYQVIVRTSRTAAMALDNLALDSRAPSRLLALARQAVSADPDTCVSDGTPDLVALAPRLKSFARPKRLLLSRGDKTASQTPLDLPEEDQRRPAK